METKLEIAKRIIKENIAHAKYGIFNSQNIVGNPMTTIYEDDDLTIDICYSWDYFEVFGLDEDEFYELRHYYYSLLKD